MKRSRPNNLRGYAEPVLRGRPLFIRLCEAFVDNLSLILKIALIIGTISFVDRLEYKGETSPDDEVLPEQVVAESPEPRESENEKEHWFSDGVEHALKCTHTEYRNEHFDECVQEPSEIYTRPGADPDDTSFIPDDAPVLYASLIRAANSDPSDP